MELKRLGKYEIVAKIGEGAMGQVHRAHDPVLNRDVAIKTMVAGIDADDELRRRFHREAQSAARLNHPNIITIYDFGEEQGHMYIAMELLEGSDLKEVINRKRPMTLDSKLDLIDQICDAVAFAHAREVIHRDLKPANIHVQPNGQVKIVDFGLARVASSAELTAAGMMMGTPHYMSPEQVRGDKASPRSDVFALAAVFYEMLAGRKAFDADSLAGVLFRVIQTEPEPLDQVRSELGPVALVLQRAMAKDPASRFAQAGELRDALREARKAERARPAHPLPRPAAGGGTPDTAGTLVRPAADSATAEARSALAKPKAPIPTPPAPAVNRRPEATAPDAIPTLPETVTTPVAPPTVALPASPPTLAPQPGTLTPAAPIPRTHPPAHRPSAHTTASAPAPKRAGGPSALQLGLGSAGVAAVGFAAWLALRPDPPIAPLQETLRPAPPPTVASPPSALPSAPPPTMRPEPMGPSVADAERSLREKDYRAALASAQNLLGRDPAAADPRRIADEARRALRTADDTAVRLRAALDARDAGAASQAFSQLLVQDPRRPDAATLAARLNEVLKDRRPEPTARPTPAAPAVSAKTPPVSLAPPTTTPAPPGTVAPAPAVSLPAAPAATVPIGQSEAAARQAIRGVLDEYRAAFERRDADALRAVQPGVDYPRMKERFASVTGYTVRVDVKEVSVKGDQGTASCVVTYMPLPKPAQKIPPQKTVFHLRRAGDVWLIERLEAR